MLTVFLYNAEVWPLTKDDTTLLEGIYTRMTKSVCLRAARMRSEAEQTKVIHTKAVDVLKLLGLPRMTALLRQKQLQWVGHALRRDDGDLSKTEVKSELAPGVINNGIDQGLIPPLSRLFCSFSLLNCR